MKRLWTGILIVCLTLPSTFVLAEEPVPVMSFSDSLFRMSVANSKSGKKKIDDSDFFCRDSKQFSSSFDPRTLFVRYMGFYKKSLAKARSSSGIKTEIDNNNEICTIYYRERYARNLFEISPENLIKGYSAKDMQEQYQDELKILTNINKGIYSENGRSLYQSRDDLTAVKDLVLVLQEYWLTRFINFSYLEKSREFAIYGVGGVALTLGTIAGLVFYLAPKRADLAAKIPRFIMNLGMPVRGVLLANSIGAGLGPSFAAASDIPSQYAVEVWPSPVEVLNMPKDDVTRDTENVERNMLLKEAYASVASVATGYIGWPLLVWTANKAAKTEFVQLLLQAIKTNGVLNKEVISKAISALRLSSTAEKLFLVSSAIVDSEAMAFLAKAYKTMHGTAAIGSMLITDYMLYELNTWIRENATRELKMSHGASVEEFNAAIEEFKKNPKDLTLSRKVFRSAQKMFELTRMLVSHLLIPSYKLVSEFSETYRRNQKVPMICSIAKMNIGPTDETMVKLFLRDLQNNERDNYLTAVGAIDLFETTIANTHLHFFTNFFKRKISLLKISFFFDEKFGLDSNKLSREQNLEEFGKGYVRVFQGELAVDLKNIGQLLLAGIQEAKMHIGKGATAEQIQDYLSGSDYLNASLYEQCLELESKYPVKTPVLENTMESISLRRWRFEP